MDRKRIQKTKYLAVFASTTLIFLVGVIIGGYFSNLKLEKIDQIQNELRINTMGTELQYEILAKDPCNFVNSTPLMEQLHEIGSKLEYMENVLGKNDKEVINLKEYYSILEIRQWLLEKHIMEKCNVSKTLVLYFYSNDEKECPECEEQGYILTYARKNFNYVNIYSFDVHNQNPALQTLVKLYNVSRVPTIVINDNKVEGFVKRAEIIELLNTTTSTSKK